jgi:hypothetical protein
MEPMKNPDADVVLDGDNPVVDHVNPEMDLRISDQRL